MKWKDGGEEVFRDIDGIGLRGRTGWRDSERLWSGKTSGAFPETAACSREDSKFERLQLGDNLHAPSRDSIAGDRGGCSTEHGHWPTRQQHICRRIRWIFNVDLN